MYGQNVVCHITGIDGNDKKKRKEKQETVFEGGVNGLQHKLV